MCLIVFAWRADPRFDLVLAANRDEFFRRPSTPAAYWHDHPHVLGGRDLEKGGSWLGISTGSQWAAVTNYREPARTKEGRSRGLLVRDYLVDGTAPDDWIGFLALSGQEYPGFNLLAGNHHVLRYICNRAPGPIVVTPGIHGLSNHLLDTPWPKVVHAKAGLETAMRRDESGLVDALFGMLADRHRARDEDLPATGVSLEWERALSASFIETPDYGTRASTVLIVRANGSVRFEERNFGPGGTEIGYARYAFDVQRFT